jgi:uncharacterized RDD family membrane protein YckC
MNSEIRYAGFWLRFLATIVDWIWLYGIVYTILWFLVGPDIFSSKFTYKATYTPTRILFEWILPFVVVMTFWITKSATPGKMLFKLRIVDADTGETVPAARLFLRYIAYFVSMLPLYFGFFWVAWDKRKQGWHDKIAKTVIVRRSYAQQKPAGGNAGIAPRLTIERHWPGMSDPGR